MVASGGAGEPLGVELPQRAGFVELLFDVVLVLALAQLSARLVKDLNWLGFYSELVLFLAFAWLWYRMAWTANRYDPARPAIQLMVIVTMLGSLLMASAIPTAYTATGAYFAGVYVAVQVLRHGWLVLLGGDRYAQLVSVRIVFWASISAVPWLAGIFVPAVPRLALWSVAVLIDYVGGALDFPTPRLGRAGLRGQPLAHEHLVDRYRQLLIIALAQAILLAGSQFAPYGFARDRTAALLVSFAITVLLWQIYFYRAGALLPEAIAAAEVPVQAGKRAGYPHLLMVIGVGLIGVGNKLIISEPFGHIRLAWVVVIIGGPVLFLAGRGMLDYAAFSHVSWSRPVGVVLLLALVPLTLRLPPLFVGLAVAAVLAAVAVAVAVAWRLFPREPAPPPS